MGAITYLILNFLSIKVSLSEVAIFLPVVFGVIGVLAVYLIGKEFSDEFTGFIAAFFYAISPSVIPRSNLGWYDTDGLGMPLLLISIYLFLKSIKTEERQEKILLSILSGFFAGLLGGTWGAFQYLYAMYGIFTIIVTLLALTPKDYELSYLPMVIIASIIVDSVPRNSLTYIDGSLAVIQYIAIALVILTKYIDFKTYFRSFWKLIGGILFISLAAGIILSMVPLGIKGRSLAVLYPYYKAIPRLVHTVQEQAGASFVYFYRDFFLLIQFTLYGFYI